MVYPWLKSVFHQADEVSVPIQGIEGTVHGVWFLGNYDLKIESGWALSGSIEGLGTGSFLLYGIDQTHKDWHLDGSIQVLDDQIIAAEGMLRQLNTLLLVSDG